MLNFWKYTSSAHIFYFVIVFGIFILRKKLGRGVCSLKPKIPKKQKLKTKRCLKMVSRLLKKQQTVWKSQMMKKGTVKCPACPWDWQVTSRKFYTSLEYKIWGSIVTFTWKSINKKCFRILNATIIFHIVCLSFYCFSSFYSSFLFLTLNILIMHTASGVLSSFGLSFSKAIPYCSRKIFGLEFWRIEV